MRVLATPHLAALLAFLELHAMFKVEDMVKKLKVFCVHSGAAWNADLMTKFAAAIEQLTDYWPDIEQEPPIGIGDGGKQVTLQHSAVTVKHG